MIKQSQEIEEKTVCNRPGRPFLIGIDRGAESAYITKPNCGLWSCRACGERKRRQWQGLAGYGAQVLMDKGLDLQFATLTHMGYLSPSGTLKRWRDCWPKLSSRFRRAAGERNHYLYVHEHHDSGCLHTHFVVSASVDDIDKRWWKDNGAQTGFGYMNDSRKVEDAGGVAWYVSKYLSKSLGENWPKNWRRIGTSRNWPKPEVAEVEDSREWLVVKRARVLREEYEGLAMQGFRVDVDMDHFGAFYDVLALAGLELSGDELAQLVP
jgi:hypothetical protein